MFLIPRTKQTYPGVTEAVEFAAVSQQNIFDSSDPANDDKMNGTGGPAKTEMIVIEGGDLLEHFGMKNPETEALYKDEMTAELSPPDEKQS